MKTMSKEDSSKLVTIGATTVRIYRRKCGCHGCKKHFWITEDSKQSICSIGCFQIAYDTIYTKSSKLPPPEDIERVKKQVQRSGLWPHSKANRRKSA